MPKSLRMTAMEKAEIKRIADYFKDLREGLLWGDYDDKALEAELQNVQSIITTLDNENLKPKDEWLKEEADRCERGIDEILSRIFSLQFVDDAEHRPFLIKVANDVDLLLIDGQKRMTFEQHSNEYHKELTKHLKLKKQVLQIEDMHRQKAAQNKRLRDYNAGRPPKEKYVWYNERGDPGKGFWGAPHQEELLPHPVLKLIPVEKGRTHYPTGIPPKNHEEELHKYYLLLTIIHDWLLPSAVPIDKDTSQHRLATQVHIISLNLLEEGQYIIERALDYVEADPYPEKPAETELQGSNMIKPTVGIMSEIIEKVRALRAKVSTLLSTKFDVPSNEPADTSIDEVVMVHTLDDEVDKAVRILEGRPVSEYIDPENCAEKLSAEQLLRSLLDFDSTSEKLLKFIGMHPKELFEDKLKELPKDELEKLQNEVMPKLLADSKNLSTQKQQLHQIKKLISRELKCREQYKESLVKVWAAIHKHEEAKKLLSIIMEAQNEIKVSMFPYMDYFTANGSWGNDERRTIETMIRSRETWLLDELIVELKQIKHKMEIEARQPTGTEQKIKPTEKPKAEVWSQIAVEVVDGDTIKYKVNNKKWERANYTELGFLDKRKNRANKLWPIFLGLASKNLPSNINRPIMKSKDIDRIRDTLRRFFGIKYLPIKYYRRSKEYRCNFKFNDPRDWTSTTQNENLVD